MGVFFQSAVEAAVKRRGNNVLETYAVFVPRIPNHYTMEPNEKQSCIVRWHVTVSLLVRVVGMSCGLQQYLPKYAQCVCDLLFSS